MKAIRYAAPVVVAAVFLTMASGAFADTLVSPPPAPTVPNGLTLLPPSGQDQSSSSSSSSASSPGVIIACGTSQEKASYSGLPGGPKTIYFSGQVSCKSPVIAVYGYATLYYGEFLNEGAYEASGSTCNYVPMCISTGSYWNATQTAPFMIHIIDWRYSATLAAGYVWASDPSGGCTGAGTRTYNCHWQSQTSVPV
jgi:hypothetical protein